MRRNRFAVFALFFVTCSVLGCAEKNQRERTFEISPVSNEESQLISLRLISGEAIRPYEQVEAGKGGVTPTEPLFELHKGLMSLFSRTESYRLSHTEGSLRELIQVLQSQRQSSLDYFKTYSADHLMYLNLKSQIPKNLCFYDGGSLGYCGPDVLSALSFLLDQPSWKPFHDWLTAIAMIPINPERVNSAAFQDFVRYFVFGLFKPLQLSSTFLTVSACHQAHENLKFVGEKPEDWELNPCNLVFAHKIRGHSLR